MALVKCRECGNAVSSKAQACPACGAPIASSSSGCIVGSFKAIGGIVGAIFGLGVALALLDGGGTKTAYPLGSSTPIEIDTSSFNGQTPEDWIAELERRCVEATYQTGPEIDRKVFLDQCIEGGKAGLRSRGMIP